MLKTKIILSSAVLFNISGASLATDLVNYRAVYDLEPTHIDQGVKAQPIDGKLAYEVAGSDCLGWTVTSDLINRTSEQEMGFRVSESKSRSYESGDGLSMTVSQQELLNDRLSEDDEIKVQRTTTSDEAKGSMSGSKKLEFTLAPDLIFPTQHQKHLLAAAAKGETHDVSQVYDGSDGVKQYRIITFIGPKRPPQEQAQPELAGLSKLASWVFQLGYYSMDDIQADAPEFQATFIMYENGLSTEMLFDYGNYAMKAKYSHMELLPTPPCEAVVAKPQ